MSKLKPFIAGFISTLIFHQGVYWLISQATSVPKPAWDMTGTSPLGIPAVVSLAFFGGLWGILLWWLVHDRRGKDFWIRIIGIGAVAPSVVALMIVFPLKGLPVLGGPDPKVIIAALILNAAWGLGVGLLMGLMSKGRVRQI